MSDYDPKKEKIIKEKEINLGEGIDRKSVV